MDHSLIIERLAKQIRTRRLNRGLTQLQLAARADLPRQKIIAIEQGNPSVAMAAFAKALAALDCELQVVPAVMPTLDDIQGMFE
jgi:HTH-type transcriptional regulator / antitoxin HipB